MVSDIAGGINAPQRKSIWEMAHLGSAAIAPRLVAVNQVGEIPTLLNSQHVLMITESEIGGCYITLSNGRSVEVTESVVELTNILLGVFNA